MHIYNALLTASNNKPVISKVIYLERRNYRDLPHEYVVNYQDKRENVFTYEAIKLWDYTEAISSGELRELAPLLILLTEKKEEEVLAKTRELILSGEDEKWRADALSVAVTVAGRYFSKEFLLHFFREEVSMLRQASIVQDWINEGIEMGIRKGMEKGEIKTLREAILDVLGERFGLVKKGISQRVRAIDDPALLRSLHKRSIKVSSLEEFVRLLDEAEE